MLFHAHNQQIGVLTIADYRFSRRVHVARHYINTIRWPRRHRPYVLRRRPSLAILQQEPRAVVVTA